MKRGELLVRVLDDADEQVLLRRGRVSLDRVVLQNLGLFKSNVLTRPQALQLAEALLAFGYEESK